MFVGVARHPGGQDEVSRGVEPLEAARAQPAKDRRVKGTPKSSKPRKKHRYLRLLPEALIRFGGFRKRTKAKSSVSKKPGKVDDSLEQPCGLGCLVSTCCECCNNIRCFMIFYCILLICQGVVFGLIDVSIGDFQKEYQLKTIEKLALEKSYDISSGLVAIFIAFYGDRKKVIWFVASSFLIGLGSLVCAFPSIHEENKQSKVGIEGIAECTLMIGYALGYVLGAPLVKVPENTTSATNTTVNNGSPEWLWTWWINFLFAAVVAWCTLIPLSCFPNNMPGSTRIKARKRKQLHFFDSRLKDLKLGTSIKDLCAALWILMKNPVFICLALSKATEYLVIIGASEFLPIYLENQFILTPTVATTLAGLVLIPGGALGQLLGGVIVSTLEMSCKALMRFIMVTSVISLILLVFIIFVRCNPVQFAGINEDYDGTGKLGNLTAPCNEKCRCSSSIYSSICGRDDIEYFSPCFAGCTYSKAQNQKKMYYNCSCIKEGLITADAEGDFIDARPGKCDAKCYKLPLFIAFIFSTLIFSGFSGVPSVLAMMRVVPDKLRSLALGVSYVILRIFGTIPGPSIFKMSGETSCILRDVNKCGHTGRCWIYNKTKMAFLLVGICFLCKLCTIVFTTIAFFIYKRRLNENTDFPDVTVKNPKVKKKEETDL
ncbi:solute carrier organic anion transporter family member 6A1 isoform X2 [Pan troglodytes]|uniref:solute carrier organic anion transporter family member 6A1 isoform X2 n=1 Tax=Pan troglodytes TaxID=9598 RepID=UPI0023F3F596|nr:solute carrier organic anion transporter family member 6A1 isoform X2 [Pan troglodytes]XP_016809045.2 solute carrier organic anion transporter family member 6A1 isoform X2 [Pan troglodytes]XP_054540439.1 solute carrier organic anion transporter family member 6A1 isoform X2 [Pan troglodytes]